MPWSFVFLLSLCHTFHYAFSYIPSSMANDTTCAYYGINATLYQYNFQISMAFTSSYRGQVFLPVFSSVPLNMMNAEATQVLISIHGLFRNADDFFCLAMVASAQSKNVVVIAPW